MGWAGRTEQHRDSPTSKSLFKAPLPQASQTPWSISLAFQPDNPDAASREIISWLPKPTWLNQIVVDKALQAVTEATRGVGSSSDQQQNISKSSETSCSIVQMRVVRAKVRSKMATMTYSAPGKTAK